MENEKPVERLNYNALAAKEGVLTIQHQKLPTPHLPTLHEVETVEIAGTISAPANFYTKRTGEIKNDKSHVRYSYRNRVITLVTMEDFSAQGSEITGQLVVNPAIKELGINEEKTFFVGELVKHIRKNKFYFADKAQHEKVVNSLQNFSANVNSEIKKINTNNGNIEDVLKVTMKSNAELRFKCVLPVFIGQKEELFDVEIACAADSNAVKFWLESPALYELLQLNTKEIIDSELARLEQDSKNELVFIEQ
jgi:hypothetical protein